MALTFEYYFYNRETDRYTYSYDFEELYEIYNHTDSFEKSLGVSVLDEYGSTQIDDILFEYKEVDQPPLKNKICYTKYKG